MKSDIEIARAARKQPIADIAARLGLAAGDILPYGHDKAKITHEAIADLADRPRGRLVLVTAINPTPAGEGKTTTTVGLGDALNNEKLERQGEIDQATAKLDKAKDAVKDKVDDALD